MPIPLSLYLLWIITSYFNIFEPHVFVLSIILHDSSLFGKI